jgi:hypothetical protein
MYLTIPLWLYYIDANDLTHDLYCLQLYIYDRDETDLTRDLYPASSTMCTYMISISMK